MELLEVKIRNVLSLLTVLPFLIRLPTNLSTSWTLPRIRRNVPPDPMQEHILPNPYVSSSMARSLNNMSAAGPSRPSLSIASRTHIPVYHPWRGPGSRLTMLLLQQLQLAPLPSPTWGILLDASTKCQVEALAGPPTCGLAHCCAFQAPSHYRSSALLSIHVAPMQCYIPLLFPVPL
jgi:hypothetical protein